VVLLQTIYTRGTLWLQAYDTPLPKSTGQRHGAATSLRAGRLSHLQLAIIEYRMSQLMRSTNWGPTGPFLVANFGLNGAESTVR